MDDSQLSVWPDARLLDAWRERGSREAMDELVRRHIGFVYGSARRGLGGDSAAAEDVAQAVFMILIQKSPRVRGAAALSVWLHRTTRYACANARRMRARRTRREHFASRAESASQNSSAGAPVVEAVEAADEYAAIRPVLDEAIAALGPRDRDGVILCYFHRRTFREIGTVLGLSEEAARKRVNRAVGRMRDFFVSRGVLTSAAGYGAVICCLSQEASAAAAVPAGLAVATSKLAGLTQIASGVGWFAGGPASSSAVQITKGVLHTMFISKLKVAAAASAAVLLGTGVTGVTVHQIVKAASLPAMITTATLVAPPDAMTANTYWAKTADDTEVRFLGVARWGVDGDGWYAIDGSKIEDPRGPFARDRLRARSDVTHQAMLYIAGHDLNGGYRVKVRQASETYLYDLTPDKDSAYLLAPFAMANEGNAGPVDIEVSLAAGDWTTLVTAEHRPGMPLGSHTTAQGGVSFTHISEDPQGNGSILYVAHEAKDVQFDVIALDNSGTEHRAVNINGGQAGGFFTYRYEFSIAPEQITSVIARSRAFNSTVTAKQVTLDPSRPTKPEISGR